MADRINPFNELYVTETIKPEQFVELFSPLLVKHVEELFLPGNVVIQGLQGSGKSMLLNLFKPQVRIAYANAKQDLPIPEACRQFIGAGINLTTSRAIDFGQRPVHSAMGSDEDLLPLYFGDFLNYWVVHDLLRAIDVLAANEAVARSMGISAGRDVINGFAKALAHDECWFEYLESVDSYADLKSALANRITKYRAFVNFNVPSLDEQVSRTKTLIGIPISRTVEMLRDYGVLPKRLPVFVRIDQYEELFHLEGKQKELGARYREVVNKALGMRDDSVSYRIGTRRYAWNDALSIFGTTARLERDRNYKLVDLDSKFRKKENLTWLFPAFAEDVFRKRLSFSDYPLYSDANTLRTVFGTGLSPSDKAKRYCKSDRGRAVRTEAEWPDSWNSFLLRLAEDDPLSGRLAEAWARQTSKGPVPNKTPDPPYPWDRPYWKKERIETALMQIAGRARQRMVWEGRDDILQLSGGNILIFVSLSQHIWDAWLRTVADSQEESRAIPTIQANEQAVGVLEASKHWFNKISESLNGSQRQRFLVYVFSFLERRLYQDLALSNPGENGFSLAIDELATDLETSEFLAEMVYFGDLFDGAHTTKNKDRRPRRKWYLNPMFSPYFRLPHIHTKEPLYVSMATVRSWRKQSDHLTISDDVYDQPPEAEVQMSLFAAKGSGLAGS